MNDIAETVERAQTAGIVGFGREGRSFLADCLTRPGPRHFVLFDDYPVPETVGAAFPGALIEIAEPGETAPRDLDILFRSPGISVHHHPILQRYAAVPVVTSPNLWLSRYREANTIVLTGTKGKSTTAALLHHVMTAIGRDVALGGNIGVPLFDITPGADWSVLELSSYQIADLCVAPTVCVLLNLYPEHVDWHGSAEQYFRDKCRLITAVAPEVAIVNGADQRIPEYIPEGRVTHRFGIAPGYCPISEGIRIGGRDISMHPALKGAHNSMNICAVLETLRAIGLIEPAGLPDATVLKAIESFAPLTHRLEELGTRDGRLYVNDSISTTPESVLAALQVYNDRPLTLLLGGFDRDQDYRTVFEGLSRHGDMRVLLLPDNGARILKEADTLYGVGHGPARALHASLEDAVRDAVQMTPEGGVILLSPGAPSYGRFQNFEARGAAFRAAAGFDEVRAR